jgi:hypothetical protein
MKIRLFKPPKRNVYINRISFEQSEGVIHPFTAQGMSPEGVIHPFTAQGMSPEGVIHPFTAQGMSPEGGAHPV